MIISLTTDFGNRDGYVGVMKGVILSITPSAQVVDISNEIEPYDIEGGAWVLANSYAVFPERTVHVAIVDPGVGSDRRPIAVFDGRHVFLGPDNGIFSYVIGADAKKQWHAVELSEKQFWRESVSSTFHGRDIFAPVAAHVANGVAPDSIGKKIALDSLVSLQRPNVTVGSGEVHGRVIYVDRFGNLITDIAGTDVNEKMTCFVDGKQIGMVRNCYADSADGAPLALIGSHGNIEISVFQGRANEVLSIGRGTAIVLKP